MKEHNDHSLDGLPSSGDHEALKHLYEDVSPDEYDAASSASDDFIFPVKINQIVLQIDDEQGGLLRDLIEEHYPYSMPHYSRKVGIPAPNLYNLFNGKKPCSLEQLNKLLSGIGYKAVITNPEIRIQELGIGAIVNDVDSIILDDESLLKESEELDMQD